MAESSSHVAEPPRLYLKEQIAAMLSVTSRTVEIMVRRGEIPAPLALGNKLVRWHADSIDRWVSAGMPKGPHNYFGHPEHAGDLLRPSEVCTMLCIDRHGLDSLTESGELPCVQVDAGITRYRLDEVESYRTANLDEYAARVKSAE